MKNAATRPDFGHFDESISRKDISPFSNKMFNFSGTKPSRQGLYQGQSSANIRGISQYQDLDGKAVNPFNHFGHRVVRDSGSIFGGASPRTHSPMTHQRQQPEEDFEIKPHNIYGEKQQAATKTKDASASEQDSQSNHAEHYRSMYLYHQQQMHFHLQNQKNEKLQSIRTCPVHGEGI